MSILQICRYIKEGQRTDNFSGEYPWLDPEDERRNMTDREILENTLIWGHHV